MYVIQDKITQDSVNIDLNNYYSQRERLEQEWADTMDEKRELAFDEAVKIMLQDTDANTFGLAYDEEYLNHSDHKTELLYNSLLEIELHGYEDVPEAIKLAELALDTACFCLFDCNTDELFSGNLNKVHRMILERVGG